MDYSYFIFFFGILAYLFIVGMPLYTFVEKFINKKRKIKNVYLLLPVFGITILIWLSTLFTKLRLSLSLLSILLFVIGILFFYFLIRRKEFFFDGKKAVLIICLILVSFLVNSTDIISTGWKEYFPLTNSDTFSYLGHIDQLMRSNNENKSILYKSGLLPTYKHAISIRTGAVSFAASINSILHIEIYQIFFLILRMSFPLILLCIIFLLENFKVRIIKLTFLSLVIIFSNFGFYSVFQQFLSSSIGIVVLWLIVAFSYILLKNKETKHSWLFLGFTYGVFGLSSLEAFFISLPLLVFITCIFFFKKNNRIFLPSFFIFIFSLVFVMVPIIKDLAKIFSSQLYIGLGSHPGNWIAQPGFIVQILGLKIFSGEAIPKDLIIFILLIIFVYLALLIYSFTIIKESHIKNRQFYYVLVAINTYFILLELCLFYLHKGYAFLKVNSYFSFFLLFTMIYLYIFCLKNINKKIKFYLNTFFILFFCLYSVISFNYKLLIQSSYLSKVGLYPSPIILKKDIKLLTEGLSDKGVVIIDAPIDLTNLLLYLGRDLPISIRPINNLNYRYKYTEEFVPAYVITGNKGEYSDINKDNLKILKTGNELSLNKAINSLFINSLNQNWLNPECDKQGICFRWLSDRGEFNIYSLNKENKNLHITVSTGPDWTKDNVLRIKNNDNIMLTEHLEIQKSEIDIPIQIYNKTTITIEILGNKTGIRQLSISHAYLN